MTEAEGGSVSNGMGPRVPRVCWWEALTLGWRATLWLEGYKCRHAAGLGLGGNDGGGTRT